MLGLPRSRSGLCAGGYWRLFPPHTVLPSPSPSDYTPCFCVSRLGGGESSVCLRFCSLHYHADNIRLFSRKVWDPCFFFPGFLLVHEKRKNNEEPVWLRLAKPWADGDVTRSPAVSGCSQTGHALSRHGVAIAWRPPHTSAPAAAQRLRGGSIGRRTKCQPSMKWKGISPSAQGWLPALARAPARSSHASWLTQGSLPGAADMVMAIIISW